MKIPPTFAYALAIFLISVGLVACGGGSGGDTTSTTTTPPVVYTGNQINISMSGIAAQAATSPLASIRSGVNYYRHWNNSAQDYIAHQHQVTRSIDLNYSLSVSTSVTDFKNRLTNSGARNNVLYLESLQKSDNLIVFFDSMPAWLSSCSNRLGSATACQAATTCGYKSGTSYHNLYPPNDWTIWTSVVTATVDTLLDLTEYNGKARNVYLEAWNEPNVRECSWNDTHANFMDYYHRTAIAFSQARTTLCASKGFTTARCERLKFGGPAVSDWNARIEQSRSTTLIEDLITDSLSQASTNLDHRLDFVSYHGFWSSSPGPRDQITAANTLVRTVYSASAGSTPPFAMPEVIISEWNGGDASRAKSYHPVIMAEAYYGLLENNINNAAIAALDAYTNTATIDTNDFGLLLPDSITTNYQRPAYFVYSAFRNLSEKSNGQPFYFAHDTFRIVATPTTTSNCYNLVLWDFAPEPLTSAVNKIMSDLPTTPIVLNQSYATATYTGTVPTACNAYIAVATNPNAAKALCSDIYNGNCASIPSPTPAGGHACDASWSVGFASAGTQFRNLISKQSVTANVSISDFIGSAGLSGVSGTYVIEDHAQPVPKSVSFGLGANSKSLNFSVNRNAVISLSNLCTGN